MSSWLMRGCCAALLMAGLACGKKVARPANTLNIAMGADVVQVLPPEGLVDTYTSEPSAKAFADNLNASGNVLEYFLVTPADKAAFHEGRNPELKRYAMIFTLKPGMRERHVGTLDFQDAKRGLRMAFDDEGMLDQKTKEGAAAISKKFSEARGVETKMALSKPVMLEHWEMGWNGTGVLSRSRVQVAVQGRALSDSEAAVALHMLDLNGHLVMLGLYGDDVTLPGLHALRDQSKVWTKAIQQANGDPWIIW